MSKTIKIIELLNKIANGEEIPKKIKYINRIYEFKYSTYGTGYLYEINGIKHWFSEDALSDSTEDLNYEVEIIEDEEEIDIQKIKGLLTLEDYECDKTDIRLNRDIINELVKAVKQLDKKVNSIEQK